MICNGMCIGGHLLQHYTAAVVPSVFGMQHNAMYTAPRPGAWLQQAHAYQAPNPCVSGLSSVRQPKDLSAATALVSQKSAAKRQVFRLNLYIPCQVLSHALVWSYIASMSETLLPLQVEVLIQQSGASPYRASPDMGSAIEALIAENPTENAGIQTLALGQGSWEVGHGLLQSRLSVLCHRATCTRHDVLVCGMLMHCRTCLLARVSRAIL